MHQKPFRNLGNFSVSGGEPTTSSHQAGRRSSLKLGPAAHVFYWSCLLCSQVTDTKLHIKPDAVKIFITDCRATVKRNSFPSTPNGEPDSQAATPAPPCLDR